MPRPKKWRRVEFVPGELCFIPAGRPMCELKEEVLKVEEMEAVRLKDIEGLNQDQCAEKMQVSRQTFQRILNQARKKIAVALVEQKALKVDGGDFTQNICKVSCAECGNVWEDSYENYKENVKTGYQCSNCGSERVVCCNKQNGFCKKTCNRRNHNCNKSADK